MEGDFTQYKKAPTFKGAPFRWVGDPNNLNLPQKWAPFYIA